jgi:hypothetical protein
MAMPHDTPVAILGLEVGMRTEKIGDLGLDCLSQQGACPIAQNIGELVVERSWLNQFMTVSLGTAYRSFGGEVEASNTPTICRLHRFMPSPTLGHSSTIREAVPDATRPRRLVFERFGATGSISNIPAVEGRWSDAECLRVRRAAESGNGRETLGGAGPDAHEWLLTLNTRRSCGRDSRCSPTGQPQPPLRPRCAGCLSGPAF